jgi:hypothetical protein
MVLADLVASLNFFCFLKRFTQFLSFHIKQDCSSAQSIIWSYLFHLAVVPLYFPRKVWHCSGEHVEPGAFLAFDLLDNKEDLGKSS